MKLTSVLEDITKEVWCTIRYTVVSNVYNAGTLFSFVLPYGMYLLGQYLAVQRGYIGVGAEIIIPLVVGIVVYYLHGIGNRANKGSSVPVPAERFTTVDEDGEVTIQQSRLSELIIYTADLEDWLTKRGRL